MTHLRSILQIAVRNILSSGSRGIVAMLCIGFGVMSLVSMSLLADAIGTTITIDPRLQVGADMSVTRASEDFILPEHAAQLKALQQQGVIEDYTLFAIAYSLMFRSDADPTARYGFTGVGVDSAKYPLLGKMTMADPSQGEFAELLAQPDTVLVTRDVATRNNLRVGDMLTISDLSSGIPVTAQLRGIVADTPNHQGGKVYYSLETAEKLAGSVPSLNTALVVAPNASSVEEQLIAQGWNAFPARDAAESQREGKNLTDLLLQGAGILALLVGGIGIANTMQVLLQRRRREVAIWKTLGYQTRDLYLMFGVEALLMGIVASVAGAVMGLLVSVYLIEIFGRTTDFLFTANFAPLPFVVGTLAGVVTTLIFALWAIVQVSRVQPMALLRNEPVGADRMAWWQGAALAAALAIPFVLLASWILGSVVEGLGVVLFAVVGMAVLAVFLGGLSWVATRMIPFGRIPLLRVSQISLQRRGTGLLFAMMALLVGVVALAIGFIFTQSANRALDARTLHLTGPNVVVIAPALAEREVARLLGTSATTRVTQTAVRSIRSTQGHAQTYLAPELLGATDPYTFRLNGAEWGSGPDGAYIYAPSPIPTGSSVEVTLWDGSVHTIPIVGRYTTEQNPTTLFLNFGLLMPEAAVRELAPPDTVRVYAELDRAKSDALALGLPQATVIDLAKYAGRFTQVYQNLFVLAVSMAGLALLAGMLLVANAVSLAMLERRYEIGVLKTFGYTRTHVLAALTFEYTLLAVITSAAGVVFVQISLWALGIANNLAARLLTMDLRDALVICGIAIALVLVTVVAVVWQPTRVSPIFILNDRA